MEKVLEESGLDWTIARPPELTGRPYTGKYRVRGDTYPLSVSRFTSGCGQLYDQSRENRPSVGRIVGTEANMTLFSVVLFFHVIAAIGLFAALSLRALSLFHLATDGSDRADHCRSSGTSATSGALEWRS
jgi:hypothetical protein